MAKSLEESLRHRRPDSPRVKINTVVIRGYNDDEVIDLLEFARREDLEIRFIEYMDVGELRGGRWIRSSRSASSST